MALQPFLNSIAILKQIAGTDHVGILKTFILSKLEGAAIECVPEDVENVEGIIKALKENIKLDSSDVIAGRLQALKTQRGNLTDYAKKAEELADAFQRALVVEGLTLSKAKEMTVKETVKVCCANARSENVRTILQAKDFTQPKEVIAKFIVLSATDKEERQVLTYKAHNRNQGNNNNNNKNRGSSQRFGNNRNGNFNRPNYQSQRFNGNANRNGYNSRGQGRNNNNRGRYYYNNNRSGGTNGSNNANANDYFMRMMTQNFQGPSGSRAANNASGQSNSDRPEQIFRIPM